MVLGMLSFPSTIQQKAPLNPMNQLIAGLPNYHLAGLLLNHY